jgi:hypothetical protein
MGSFSLYNKLLTWNRSISVEDRWVNELIFATLCVILVYPVAWLADALVLNSIEFWTGENPCSEVQVKQVNAKNGRFTITTDTNGHIIQKEGTDEIVEFHFNREENSWSLETMGETIPLLQFVENNQAKVFLADGSTLTVSLDRAGMLALKQAIEMKAFLAVK